ncbi:MAG: ATP-dependent 6-phosphofructokinase [Pirellulaceae bacterium]
MIQQQDLNVTTLGECRYRSPLVFESPSHARAAHMVTDSCRIRFSVELRPEPDGTEALSFEEAGPRERIFFDPAKTTAAVVTCGGLSPGLNNVIRSLFYELEENYGVQSVLGIRNGYLGLTPEADREPMILTRDYVEPIDKLGGTKLGSSRGPQDPSVMVDFLQARKIDMLFCLGGDGTQRGAHAIHEEVARRGLSIAIVGIPKTIDNDIPFVRQAFGYVTALEKAAEVIRGAHIEARDAVHGVALVKLMGRHAGFIAAGASVVSQEVNFTLVPELPFPLDGENGFLAALERRIRKRRHAVIVVAEGAGQHLFDRAEEACDTSGNRLSHDIASLLKTRIKAHFAQCGLAFSLKYLDPSYFIRSVPANAFDRFLCDQMGRHAVHAAMAGKTGMLIGYEHNQFIHVPIPAVASQEKQLDVTGDLWRAVLQVTRQPRW